MCHKKSTIPRTNITVCMGKGVQNKAVSRLLLYASGERKKRITHLMDRSFFNISSELVAGIVEPISIIDKLNFRQTFRTLHNYIDFIRDVHFFSLLFFVLSHQLRSNKIIHLPVKFRVFDRTTLYCSSISPNASIPSGGGLLFGIFAVSI